MSIAAGERTIEKLQADGFCDGTRMERIHAGAARGDEPADSRRRDCGFISPPLRLTAKTAQPFFSCDAVIKVSSASADRLAHAPTAGTAFAAPRKAG